MSMKSMEHFFFFPPPFPMCRQQQLSTQSKSLHSGAVKKKYLKAHHPSLNGPNWVGNPELPAGKKLNSCPWRGLTVMLFWVMWHESISRNSTLWVPASAGAPTEEEGVHKCHVILVFLVLKTCFLSVQSIQWMDVVCVVCFIRPAWVSSSHEDRYKHGCVWDSERKNERLIA